MVTQTKRPVRVARLGKKMRSVINWWRQKQYKKAVETVNKYGQSVVILRQAGNTTYIQRQDGSLWKINKVMPEFRSGKK